MGTNKEENAFENLGKLLADSQAELNSTFGQLINAFDKAKKEKEMRTVKVGGRELILTQEMDSVVSIVDPAGSPVKLDEIIKILVV